MIKLILWGILFFLGYTVVQMVKGMLVGGRSADGQTPDRYTQKGEKMVEDAYDGTFFPLSQAVTVKKDGQTLYFASEKNRDAYLKDKS